MIETPFHPTPRGRDVVLEQFRIVGLHIRIAALVIGVVLGVVTIAIAIALAEGRAETWFDGHPSPAIEIVSFLFPFAVWRGERRFGSACLWTLPVDRRRLALMRVFAAWMWLMLALALFAVWRVALAFLAGASVAHPSFITSTASYLLGSALVLGLRHPLRWLLGTASVVVLLSFFNEHGPYNINALTSRAFLSIAERAMTATFLWLGVGLAALWLAASRHRETR